MTDAASELQRSIHDGKSSVTDDFLCQVYSDLRRLAGWKLSREGPGQTLQPTALVHETYLRLVEANRAVELGPSWPFLPCSGRGDAAHSDRACADGNTR